MRPAPMLLLLACSIALITAGCSDSAQPTAPATPTQQPPSTAVYRSPTGRVGYFASPSGSSSGAGSWDRPWDLKTALAGAGGKVQPGDTIWVRGGTYRGAYVSTVKGTSSAPVVVRGYPGERAIIDGNGSSNTTLNVKGAYSVFWGLEIMNSNTNRTFVTQDSRPNGVWANAPRLRFINMVVHDTYIAFYVGKEGPGAEIYGTIAYNNGSQGSDRGHGHAAYLKNDGSTVTSVRDNIFFNQYGYGVHVYTNAGSGQLKNMRIEGNAAFNNGTLATNSTSSNILIGGEEPADQMAVVGNMLYFSPGLSGTNAKLAYSSKQNGSMSFTGNYVAGGNPVLQVGYWNGATVTGNTFYGTSRLIDLYDNTLSGYTWSNNQYYGNASTSAFKYLSGSYSLSSWKTKTALGAGDVSTSGSPTGVKVFVRPNQYEKGRGNIVVYNWAQQGAVSVDMSKVLSMGDRYEVRNVQNLFGTPVASGTYGGGSISIPMTGVTPPKPIGGSKAGPKTGPYFDAFVVTKVGG